MALEFLVPFPILCYLQRNLVSLPQFLGLSFFVFNSSCSSSAHFIEKIKANDSNGAECKPLSSATYEQPT